MDKDKANATISEMTKRVQTTWYDTVRACGVSERDAEAIKSAFVYNGFSY